MKNKTACFQKTGICTLLLLVGITSQAQDSPGLALSLLKAQDFAIEHNRTIANASLDVQKAEAAKWKSIASMLPQVAGTADFQDMCGYKLDLGEMLLSMPASISYGVTTSVAISGAQIVSVGLQKLSLEMSQITLRKNELEIRNQTKNLYCSALVAEETLGLVNESLESLQIIYDMTCKSVEVGVAEQTDADQLYVQILTMQNTIASTKRSIEMVYNSIRLLLNIEAGTPLELTDNLESILNIGTVNAVMEEEFDIDRNYSYQLLQASTDLAKKQVSLTGLSNGPTVSLFHQYTYKQYLSNERTMNMTPPNMVGVSLKIPIFTSLSNTNAYKDAKLNYRQQVNNLEQTRYSMEIQHAQLVYNLRTALDTYTAQVQNVDVAKRVFNNIVSKYQHGISSSMDVTNANNSLITAKTNYVQSVLDIMTAQISLEELLNK